MSDPVRMLVNIDVPDLERGIAFYTAALGLTVGRRLGPDIAELLGTDAPIYLLAKPGRDYRRHWTPVHLDLAVDDLDAASARALAAGAVPEGVPSTHPWGRLAVFADPFGHGFCLLEFHGRGYDEIATPEDCG